MNVMSFQNRICKFFVLSLCSVVVVGGLTACSTNDLSKFSGTIDVIPITQMEKETSELTFDPLDHIVEKDGFSNQDTTQHTLPLAEDLKAEDTDLYQIQHNFTLPGEEMRQPDYYSLEVESGTIAEIIPGTWGSAGSDSSEDSDLPEWTLEFFRAFQDADYETMKQFCTEDAQNFFFRENSAFWFRSARPLTAEIIETDSETGKVTLRFLVDGIPAEGSALEDRDGPYLVWLSCMVDDAGNLRIDSCTTQSQMFP